MNDIAMRSTLRPRLSAAALLLAAIAVAPARAQTAGEIKPAPMITGYGGVFANFQPGQQSVNPTITPVLLVPLGQKALVEAEFETEGEWNRTGGVWGPRTVEKGIEYVQLDYFANKYVTVVGGRFLTPFGVFNERLHPIWVKDLMNAPLIFGLEHGSGMGGMLRGGIPLSPSVNLNYASFFSANSTNTLMESERSAGGRWSLFLAKRRIESGFSFKRNLGDERFNSYGGDATWNLTRVPLTFRSEYAHATLGSGYWVEASYRTVRISRWRPLFRRLQIVARMEQFFAPKEAEEGHAEEEEEGEELAMIGPEPAGHGHMAELPEHNTRRPMAGFNYYFKDGLKGSFAWGREMTPEGNQNVWSVGLAYRFGY